LIKNAVEQGKQAVENIAKKIEKDHFADYDLLNIGLGPAGISASLAARKHKLKTITLDQYSLGGTVYTFPRTKIVMTSPMDLPLLGKIKLFETSKDELLGLWKRVIQENSIEIAENTKVEAIDRVNNHFETSSTDGKKISSKNVLLAIGRRGSPRKLNIPGEESDLVAYKLMEPEFIEEQKIVVVGGGDSAIEAALALKEKNEVMLSYRGDAFKRLKPKNREELKKAEAENKIDIRLNSNLLTIEKQEILLKEENNEQRISADRVYIFAGGELPTEFLKKTGITITRKFGETILKH
ncbi:MAG: NAD(P)-binding domain-containing protein, partial [Bacteroidales bacterium]|nr:NAD(P)-binding domain-containing protein [Bacteroidales bacterium]